jgi:FkbM family methyltransferase
MLLRDEASRSLFVRLLLYRLLGHLHVRIKDDATASSEAALNNTVAAWRNGPSTLPLKGAFGGMDHFEGVPFAGQSLAFDCWAGGLVALALRGQYHFDRPHVRICPEPGDVVIDAGAFVGETAVAFAASVGPAGHVHAFDPLPDHLTAIRHNSAQNGFSERITVVPRALADKANDIAAISVAGLDPGFSIARERQLPLTTIDAYLQDRPGTRVDYLKMDIEGAELAALHGARGTLTTHRPKLAISLYHRNEDFVAIPLFLAGLLPDYEFYLEHYTIHAEETVLYGRPRQ